MAGFDNVDYELYEVRGDSETLVKKEFKIPVGCHKMYSDYEFFHFCEGFLHHHLGLNKPGTYRLVLKTHTYLNVDAIYTIKEVTRIEYETVSTTFI